MSRWTKVSVIVTIVLIGIPTAARFYPPLFAGLAEQLPLDLILTWMVRIGLLILGILLGWFARDFQDDRAGRGIDASNTESEIGTEDGGNVPVDEIEGCIEVGESCWRGTAELSNRQVHDTEVAYKAICPECQTVMYDGESGAAGVATTAITFWDCPSCGHQTVEKYSKYEDAQNLFNSNIRRIVESSEEEYSLDTLIENIDGEVTPRGIWEQYVEVRDDQHVSVDCFY